MTFCLLSAWFHVNAALTWINAPSKVLSLLFTPSGAQLPQSGAWRINDAFFHLWCKAPSSENMYFFQWYKEGVGDFSSITVGCSSLVEAVFWCFPAWRVFNSFIIAYIIEWLSPALTLLIPWTLFQKKYERPSMERNYLFFKFIEHWHQQSKRHITNRITFV